MHELQVFCYLGAGLLAFIFSGIFIRYMFYVCSRMMNRQSQATAQTAAAGSSGYREVVVKMSASRVEVVVEAARNSSSDESDGNNNNEKKGCLNSCAICIFEIEDGVVCWELTACNHRFHADCIQKWLKKSKSCPLCRTVITAHT